MLHSPFVLIDILGETIAYFCSSRFIMAYSLFSYSSVSNELSLARAEWVCNYDSFGVIKSVFSYGVKGIRMFNMMSKWNRK